MVTELAANALRAAADLLSPPPPRPSARLELTVTRSRRKKVAGIEWLPETLDHEPLDPPLESQRMGPYDSLDLSHDVKGYDLEGQPTVVSNVWRVTWREVHE